MKMELAEPEHFGSSINQVRRPERLSRALHSTPVSKSCAESTNVIIYLTQMIQYWQATDFLQTLLNHAVSSGTLSLPIPLTDQDFSILQYVDDTLIFIKACPTELTHLKDILSSFVESSGLKANYSKSMIVPLNVHHDSANLLLKF